ncbi:MAG: NAD(P)H-hydrate epimerase, partial [Arcanobacterium sp.]|nr:NAD(P)H-hydrate epimerase [Arcanobacterium sp.]
MIRAFKIADVRAADATLLAAGERLMERAAYGLANRVLRDLRKAGQRIPGSTVLALVGSGNNGGDALFAGGYLSRRGLQVVAIISDDVHQSALDFAVRSGVRIFRNPSSEQIEKLAIDAGIWLDGIFGIGAKGAVRGEYANWLSLLVQLKLTFPEEPKVYAVDLPSGVNADTGEISEPVLSANVTVTMGCAKPGLFLDPAAAIVGEVEIIDLGYERVLPQDPSLEVFENSDFLDYWFVPQRDEHKYSRGVLGLFAGSADFPGAAVLAAKAAANTGLGMLQYYGEAHREVLAQVPEAVIKAETQELIADSDFLASAKFTALVFGPGYPVLDPKSHADCAELTLCKELLKNHLLRSENTEEARVLPVILDGGAMPWILDPELRNFAQNAGVLLILTPHRGELIRLCQLLELSENSAEALARETGCVVVDKGNTTTIVTPEGVR